MAAMQLQLNLLVTIIIKWLFSLLLITDIIAGEFSSRKQRAPCDYTTLHVNRNFEKGGKDREEEKEIKRME